MLIDIDSSTLDPRIRDMKALADALRVEFSGAEVVVAEGPVVRAVLGFGASTRIAERRLRIALIDHAETC